MAENFQNLSTNTNLYIQEAHLILNGINLDLQTCNLVGGKKGWKSKARRFSKQQEEKQLFFLRNPGKINSWFLSKINGN